MTSQNFAYWLMGFFEVANPSTIGSKETELIKKHLALVFKHEIDPEMGDEQHQAELNAIHAPNKLGGYLIPTHEDGVMRC
jgi:hypothetical protein